MDKLLCAVCIAMDYEMPGESLENNPRYQKPQAKAAITIAAGTAVCNDHFDCIHDGGTIRSAVVLASVVEQGGEIFSSPRKVAPSPRRKKAKD